MSQTEELLIIYETEAKQWASYLQSAFAGAVSEDGICCYDIATVSSRRDDFLRLCRYACKLLILSRGMLECLCQMRRFFLSRVLSPAGCVVVLLCGVDSLSPLLDLVALQGDQCLKISSDQEPPEYLSTVLDLISKGKSAKAANVRSMSLRECRWEQKPEQMQSSGADRVKSDLLIVPSRVPCGRPSEVFVLLRRHSAAQRCEIEFRAEKKAVRVKAACWSESVLFISAPDFPSGSTKLTVYSDGKALGSSSLHYFSNMEELSCALSRVASPVEFMCQALQVSSVDKLDEKLSSMLQGAMPTGGSQGENMHDRAGDPHTDMPSLLHFAACYGLRSVSGLLLRCPGAEHALLMPNRHGQKPSDIAKSNGHEDLHALLKKQLKTRGSGEEFTEGDVYEMMSHTSSHRRQHSEVKERDEEDIYTPLEEDSDPARGPRPVSTVDLSKRPPAPTPRPECTLRQGKTPYIHQAGAGHHLHPSGPVRPPKPRLAPPPDPVFKNKTCAVREDTEVYSFTSKAGVGSSSTYDTFMPKKQQQHGLEQLREIQKRGKISSVSVARELEKKKKMEKLNAVATPAMSSADDCVYDQINNAPHGPSVQRENRRGARPETESEFYSKPRRGPQVLPKTGKRRTLED